MVFVTWCHSWLNRIGSCCVFDSHGDCDHEDHGHGGYDQGTCSADGHTDNDHYSDGYGSEGQNCSDDCGSGSLSLIHHDCIYWWIHWPSTQWNNQLTDPPIN